MHDLVHDFRSAARSLARRPLVTAIAVLSLALGVGVNTTIFSAFERLLLRQVSAPSPDRLVNLVSPGPKPGGRSGGNGGGTDYVFSYALFRDLERLTVDGVSRLAAHRDFGANLAWRGTTARAEGLLVSGSYFDTLGATPAVGRLLGPDDDRVEGGHPVVVLSHRYWMTQFAGDPLVVGTPLVINGEPMTVVGVTAGGFTGTVALDTPQLFVPLSMTTQVRAWSTGRRDHYLYLFARLQPGVTPERAEAALNGPFTALLENVELPVHSGELIGGVRDQFLARRIVLEDGRRARVSDRQEARLIIGLLLAVTGLVLLIACANVSNLLLARAADRARELAVRVSMGASTARLVRLLLLESLLLGALAAVGALGVARAANVALMRLLPPSDGSGFAFEFNLTIVLYALTLGLGTGLVFGLAPALHSLRSGRALATSPQSDRHSSPRKAARFRTSLATAQIALATALLAVAGLFITSLVNLARVDLGIQREGVLSFRIAPYVNGYTPERAMVLFEQVADELRRTAGVTTATATTVPLLAENSQRPNVLVEGFDVGPDADRRASYSAIGEDYFRTLGIPVIAGREFTRADAAGAPRVAIVNESFVRKFRLDTGALGRRIGIAAAGKAVPDVEIVGIVRDFKYSDVHEPAPPQFFFPYRQAAVGPLTFYARASIDPDRLRPAIPALMARLDATLPVERLITFDEQIWDNVTRDRVLATLSSWFATLATVLAGIGLYGILAFAVTQRVKEIGIRMALGARTVDVARMLGGQVGRMTMIGTGVGIAIALALSRLAQALLFGMEGTDRWILAGAAAAMTMVVIVAAIVPARRATHVNPVVALRAE